MSRKRVLWAVALLLLIVAVAAIVRPPTKATGLSDANSVGALTLSGAQAAEPLRILVIGGTRGTGRAVAELAAARGHQVTAMARRPPEEPFADASIAFTAGDVTDASAVAKLTADQSVVVTAISTSPSRQPINVYSTGITNVLAASQGNPQLRLVSVTGVGAGDSRGHGGHFYDAILWPLLLRTAYEDKDREEDIIRASQIAWTIVRPGFLTNDAMTGHYAVVTDIKDVRSGSISRKDVAHFILAAIEARQFQRQTVLLTK